MNTQRNSAITKCCFRAVPARFDARHPRLPRGMGRWTQRWSPSSGISCFAATKWSLSKVSDRGWRIGPAARAALWCAAGRIRTAATTAP